MPKRTVYVREGDIPTWNKAEKFAKGNISSALSEALSDYVAKKESEMITASKHGRVMRRWLCVWNSPDLTGVTAHGKEFDSLGTGPHQAQALVNRLKANQSVRHVTLEERRKYEDGTLENESLAAWSRPAEDWVRVAS